jgi:hypothetical protein
VRQRKHAEFMLLRYHFFEFFIKLLRKKYESAVDFRKIQSFHVVFDKFRGAKEPGISWELHIRTL